jgi:dynein heavy chain 2, cytosolic
VLFGSGLLTPAIQSAATALLSGLVPGDWRRAWDLGPEKPQAWLRDLVTKRINLGKWKASLSKGGSAALLSAPLSLGDLFNPATFINALRQQTARKLGTAIDLVKMVCNWDKDPRRLASACPLVCTLSNLLLQGADFHPSNGLQESAPEAAEMSTAPPVCIGFVPVSSEDTYPADSSVAIPIYLSPSREDVLTELQMPIRSGDPDKWVLSGVALFLSGDDA